MWTNPAWSLAVVTFSSRNTREMSYSSIQSPQLFFLSVCKQKFRNNSDVPWCPVHMYTHTHTHKGGWGGVGVQTALQFQAIPAKEQKKKVCLLACKKTDVVVNRDFVVVVDLHFGKWKCWSSDVSSCDNCVMADDLDFCSVISCFCLRVRAISNIFWDSGQYHVCVCLLIGFVILFPRLFQYD